MKIAQRPKNMFVLSFAGLAVAGMGYWLSRLLLRTPGAFGDEPHLAERILGPVHLVAAFLFIYVLGIIWVEHIQHSLPLSEKRVSGWTSFALVGGLALTGVVMIYGSERLVRISEQIHPWIGAVFVMMLLFHWGMKYRSRQRRRRKGR